MIPGLIRFSPCILYANTMAHCNLYTFNDIENGKTRMHSSRMRTARSLPYGGLLDKDPPPEQRPLDRDPSPSGPGQRPPGQRLPRPTLDRDPPWTETPLWIKRLWKHYLRKLRSAGSNKEQDFVHQRNTDFTQHFGNSFGKSFFFWGWLCVILLSISGNGYLEAILFQQLKCAIVSVFQESECLMIRYGRN